MHWNRGVTETEILHFMLTLPLAKLVMIGEWLGSNGLIFSDDIPVDIQLVTLLLLLLLSNFNELSLGPKLKNFGNQHQW